MKLCRVGPPGHEKPAVLDPEGRLRDVSAAVPDFTGDFFTGSWRGTLQQALRDAPLLPADPAPRFGVPVAKVSKVVGVGMNYHEGVRRAGMTTPLEPLLFIKPSTCLAAADDPIVLPPGADKLDWEVELGVVIGREATRLAEDEVDSAILGYCVFNDLSERRWQNEQGGEWCKGKSADGFGPCGPWLVTADEVADPGKLDLWLDLSGARQQSSNTADMVFSVHFVVGYISRFMRLLPGDIVIMGTPPGTGWRLTPPRFLRLGDRLSLGIQGLGEQNTVVEAPR
ncbi:MAG TPA: fumarylacetoacetate hydrolase family protein [Reyranella sp.]|nr:fumarylacetoacetate hydrolase family protein [Reyranella sp.]